MFRPVGVRGRRAQKIHLGETRPQCHQLTYGRETVVTMSRPLLTGVARGERGDLKGDGIRAGAHVDFNAEQARFVGGVGP